MTKQVRALAAAFTFFTRIPLSKVIAHDESDLARSSTYFPVVGIVVGAVGGFVFALSLLFWPPIVAVMLSTIATVLLTGAFHEDALADSLDGFGGGWNKEQVLAIMKDSRVGSYALVGVTLAIAAKLATLYSISTNAANLATNDAMKRAYPVIAALISAHTLGRWSSVWLIHTNLYVRSEEASVRPSAGRPFVNAVTPLRLVAATVVTLATAISLLQRDAPQVLLVAFIVTLLAGRYFRKRIGGITGDALGAANQIVELSVYLVLSAKLAT